MLNLATASPEDIEEFFEAVAAGIAVFDVTENGALTMVACNAIYRSMHHIDRVPIPGSTIHTLLPRYEVKQYREQFRRCVEQRCPIDEEMVVDIAGVPHWYRVRMVPVYAGEVREMARLFTTTIDVTQQHLLEQKLDVMNSRLEAIVDSTYDAIVSIDNRQRIKTFNLAAEELFCYDRADVIGKPLEQLLPEQARASHAAHVDAFGDSPVMSRPMEARVEVSGLRSDGTEFPAEVAIAKIRVHGNTEYTAIIRDISVQLRLQEELKQRANSDPLTALANRRFLFEVAESELERSRRYGHPLSFLTLDVDNFKSINDTYGHAVGDVVLKSLGNMLIEQARKIDVPARIGGEEICMLIPETDLRGAEQIAERIRSRIRMLHNDIPELGASIITASIGVTEYRASDNEFEQILERADQAMYEAKRSGKDRVVVTAE